MNSKYINFFKNKTILITGNTGFKGSWLSLSLIMMGAKVIGLSKLNRLVEHFGRRGAIQEQLTVAIHHAVNTIINDNNGVAVMIDATHNCVQCRGVKHGGASMKTSKLTGAFKDDPATRNEYYEFIRGYGNCNT
mgnify:CR=1 FL=1